jgi:hypothetical protein
VKNILPVESTNMSIKNLSYDVRRDGFDASRWKTVGGTPTIAGDEMTLTQAGVLEKSDVFRGDLTMRLVIPTEPATGDSREFGMKSLSSGAYAVFNIIDDVFYASVSDQDGNIDSATLSFDGDWAGMEVDFRVVFQSNMAKFYIDNSPVAVFAGIKTPRTAMGVYINNGNNDVMLFRGYDLLGAEVANEAFSVGDITASIVASPNPSDSYAEYQNNSFTTAVVKASPGKVFSATIVNTSGSDRYIQFFDQTTVVTGGETAKYKCIIPAGGALIIGTDFFGQNGKEFDSGIVIANSTTLPTYTAGSAGDITIDLEYDGEGGGSSGYLLTEDGFALLMENSDTIALED